MSADEVIQRHQRVLVARSRQQAASNDYARAFVRMCRQNIVGPQAVMLQAQSRDDKGRLDVLANQAIEVAFDAWGRREHCDVVGRLSWRAIQPKGILKHTGVNAVSFAAANPSFAELVDMETQIAIDNADVSSMAYVANAKMRGYAKTALKHEGIAGTIWEQGGTINGYRTEVTNQIEDGHVFMGNFSDLIIGMWGGLDLTVDPYSGSKSGRLRIVVFQDVDFALWRVESFCIGKNG